MRRIGDPSFFRVLDRVIGNAVKDTQAVAWTIDAVTWQRERHSYSGAAYSFATEVITGTKSARPGWSIIVVKEYWWKGGKREVLKSHQWASLAEGSRTDLFAWLNRQDARLG